MSTNRVRAQKSLIKKMIEALQEQQANHRRHMKTMNTMIAIMKKFGKNLDVLAPGTKKRYRYTTPNTPNNNYY
jgi:hypothetical protein